MGNPYWLPAEQVLSDNIFVKTVLENYKPSRLVIFSRDELKQFEMEQMLSTADYPCLRYFIGDVRDRARIIRACAGIDIIVHAAAMKHITAAEYNPTECIATNILGAQNIIDAAIEHNVQRVIALSTDKAANPINLYGATKLCSDKLFIAANNLAGKHQTRFAVVRYGNVIGSRGSVIPFFKKLAAGGTKVMPDHTCRHDTVCDYARRGVEFVLHGILEMFGGEIFVPKLPSMKILDIVDFIAPGAEIKVIGIRPGEKLHEIMIPLEESRNVVDSGDHYIIQPAFNCEYECAEGEIVEVGR